MVIALVLSLCSMHAHDGTDKAANSAKYFSFGKNWNFKDYIPAFSLSKSWLSLKSYFTTQQLPEKPTVQKVEESLEEKTNRLHKEWMQLVRIEQQGLDTKRRLQLEQIYAKGAKKQKLDEIINRQEKGLNSLRLQAQNKYTEYSQADYTMKLGNK